MKTFVILATMLFAASPAAARDFTIGGITVARPLSHSMVPGAKVGDGYFTITNSGDQPDTLISARSDRAKSVQLHEMKMDNGVMVMRELKGGLAIPAGQTVRLEPDYHLMFNDVQQPFRQGEEIKAVLTFEKAGSVEVTFAVGKIAGPLDSTPEPDSGAMNMPDMTMSGMDMPGMDMGAMQPPEDPQLAIPALLKTMFETADKPLTIEPVVVQNDWAIAGWQQDGRGGRALLKRGEHGWRIRLSSGDGIRDAAALEKTGLSPADATALSAALKDAESALDPKVLTIFASFEGTVVMGDEVVAAGHGGHEGHGK